MILIPVQDFLAARNLGVTGRTLFIHSMPDKVTTGVLLMESLTGAVPDHELPGYFRVSFQVVVRNPNFEAGQAQALAIYKALTFRQEQELGSLTVKECLPRHLPVAFQRTPGNSLEFSVNFDVRYVDPSM